MHLARLVQVLDGPRSRFFIHVDLKADIAPFPRALPAHERVHFLERQARVAVSWGGYSGSPACPTRRSSTPSSSTRPSRGASRTISTRGPSVANEHGCHYIDWDTPDRAEPKALDLSDAAALLRSRALCARKFAEGRSDALRRRLEEHIRAPGITAG